MIRFPNPGSDIDNFVAVYNAAFDQLYGQLFDLDALVAAVVTENLATSSGYMGEAAIARSTRPDRSRDPLYNQLKMYSEIFRALGWIHPTEQSALNFTFTLLGRQVVAAGQYYRRLLEETVLGITYPSQVLAVKGSHVQRPFAFLMLTMSACGNCLSRDEMIVGPLSAESDQGDNAIADMTALVQRVRQGPGEIKAALDAVAIEQGVQVNTLKNYTRWPIAVMRDLGWTQKGIRQYDRGGKSFEVHELTGKGREIVDWVLGATDLRLEQIEPARDSEGQMPLLDPLGSNSDEDAKLSIAEMTAVSIHAHYQMLERSGFDLESVRPILEEQEPLLNSALAKLNVQRDRPLLFSPYQSLSISDVSRVFPASEITVVTGGSEVAQSGSTVGRDSRDHLFVEPALVLFDVEVREGGADDLKQELLRIFQSEGSIEEAATKFALSRKLDSQSEFYPMVSGLFRLLGFDSEYSRAGVNSQRMDAWVYLEGDMVPIEIKSPTEELSLSTKAVRQALENKIILLSRSECPPRFETTSLIVGYQIPNERGEMAALIDDVYVSYDISIGVIDLRTLALLAIRAVTENVTVQSDQLRTLRGFLYA